MASILVIDDDENLRDMTVALLRADGHDVKSANDGAAGLALYRVEPFDLVITDIVMPDMDGLQLIGELRKTANGPRIIAISGGSEFSQGVYLPYAKKFGVDRILAKPLRPEVFLHTVADVLAKPGKDAVAAHGEERKWPWD